MARYWWLCKEMFLLLLFMKVGYLDKLDTQNKVIAIA